MIERWLQFTCDACGATEFAPSPDVAVAVAAKEAGFTIRGKRHLCIACAKRAK